MLAVRTHAGVVHATLDAPATRNALTDEMVAALREAVDAASRQAEVRALVIRGAGGHFCAGGDFSRFKAAIAQPAPADGLDPIAVFNRGFGAMLERLAACAVATVAVVDGAAIGGGCGLAACCDIVLASSASRFATPEVTLGLPPAQIAPFVAARVGHAAALRLMLTGQPQDAEAALAMGLADEVKSPDGLDDRLSELLGALRRAEPQALRDTKAILQRRREASLGQTLDFAADRFAAALRSGSAAEGLAAFAAKRAPRWADLP